MEPATALIECGQESDHLEGSRCFFHHGMASGHMPGDQLSLTYQSDWVSSSCFLTFFFCWGSTPESMAVFFWVNGKLVGLVVST